MPICSASLPMLRITAEVAREVISLEMVAAISEAGAPSGPPRLLIRILPRSRLPTLTMPDIRTSSFTSLSTKESMRIFFDFSSLAFFGPADFAFTCASRAFMLLALPLPSKSSPTLSISTDLIRITDPVTEATSRVTCPLPTESKSSRLNPFGLPMRKSFSKPVPLVSSIRRLPKCTDTPVACSVALTTALRINQSLPL